MQLPPTRRRHMWTERDRLVLILLNKIYENSFSEVTPIFNRLRSHSADADVSASGLEDLTSGAVQRQFNDIRLGEMCRAILVDSTLSEARNQYRDIRDEIEECAIELGIVMRLRASDPQIAKPKVEIKATAPVRASLRRKRRASSSSSDSGVLPCYISSEDESDAQVDNSYDCSFLTPSTSLLTPRRNASSLPSLQPESLPTPPKSTLKLPSQNRLLYNRTPRLLYRWYRDRSQGLNTPTGFRSGLYIDPLEPVPEPSWPYAAVRNHLVPEHEPSPFISFRDTLRSAMRRALKAREGAQACIAVVDFEALKKCVGEAALRAAPELVREFDLHLPVRKGLYSGCGEWLVFGTVPQLPIVATITMQSLYTYLNSIPRLPRLLQVKKLRKSRNALKLIATFNTDTSLIGSLNYHSGITIREWTLVLGIDEPCRTYFAEGFAAGWSLRPREGVDKDEALQEFLDGVQGVQREDKVQDWPETQVEAESLVRDKPRSVKRPRQPPVIDLRASTPPPRPRSWDIQRFIYVEDPSPPSAGLPAPISPQTAIPPAAEPSLNLFLEQLQASADRASTPPSPPTATPTSPSTLTPTSPLTPVSSPRAESIETDTSEAVRLLNSRPVSLPILSKTISEKKMLAELDEDREVVVLTDDEEGEEEEAEDEVVMLSYAPARVLGKKASGKAAGRKEIPKYGHRQHEEVRRRLIREEKRRRRRAMARAMHPRRFIR